MDKAVNYRYITLREALTECISHRRCADCKHMKECGSVLKLMTKTRDDVSRMIDELKAEKGRPDVWDGAPEWAKEAQVHFWDGYGHNEYSTVYPREPPKSRIDEIAAEVYSVMCDVTKTKEDIIDGIKSALLSVSAGKEVVNANR